MILVAGFVLLVVVVAALDVVCVSWWLTRRARQLAAEAEAERRRYQDALLAVMDAPTLTDARTHAGAALLNGR